LPSTRYLVTGGAGFIGSHLSAKLLDLGHQVVVLDDLSSGRRENLERISAPGLDFVHGSLLDEASLRRATEGVEAVFHQAAIPSVPRSFADPASTLAVNVEGTARLLESCRAGDVNKIVVASSSSVYGDTPTLPKQEDMRPSPLSPYALSKLTVERLCHIYSREYGFEIVALRYFNIFGPWQDPESQYAAVVPRFITAMLQGESPTIYGDGLQSRDFTFVENVVAANLLAGGVMSVSGPGAESTATDGATNMAGAVDIDGAASTEGATVANIACGERYTLLDLVGAINRILGTEIEPQHAEPRSGDVLHSQASIERARQRLGYDPQVDFEEGLRRTVAWFAAA
jgi:UDP-glucose 4-epimerase